MLVLGAVVVAPIVLSQLGSSGTSETLIRLRALADFAWARGVGVDDPLSLRPEPVRPAVDLALPRECHRCGKLAGPLRAIFLVHSPFRQLRRHLRLFGRGDRHDDLDVDFNDRRASRGRTERPDLA